MPSGSFTSWHHAHVEKLLRRCEVRVAHNPDNESALYGFSLIEEDHIHMVYVSKSHWRSGIGRALLGKRTLSECIFRIWPNTSVSSELSWLRPILDEATYLPYWMETKHGE
jgi:hypothetical protein